MSGPPWYEMPLLPAALPDGRAALSTARGAACDPRAGTICFGRVVRAWSLPDLAGAAPAGAAITAGARAAAPALRAGARHGRRDGVEHGASIERHGSQGAARRRTATPPVRPGYSEVAPLFEEVTLVSRFGK